MRTSTITTVNLLDVLRALQVAEWTALGLPTPDTGTSMDLPDGRDDIHSRLWDVICRSSWGNQVFNNDSIFKYVFTWEDPMDEDEQLMYNLVKEFTTKEFEFESIYFDVCW
jgi:hypothetical protein